MKKIEYLLLMYFQVSAASTNNTMNTYKSGEGAIICLRLLTRGQRSEHLHVFSQNLVAISKYVSIWQFLVKKSFIPNQGGH